MKIRDTIYHVEFPRITRDEVLPDKREPINRPLLPRETRGPQDARFSRGGGP